MAILESLGGLLGVVLLVGLLYSPITIGLALSFRLINYPDLTCEGAVMFSGALSFVVLHWGFHPLASVGIGLVAGALAGAVTGLMHITFGVSRLLSGVITTAVLYSTTIRLLGGKSNLRAKSETVFDWFNAHNDERIDLVLTGGLALLVVMFCIIMLYSRVGRTLRALGDHEKFVIALGKNPRFYTVIGLILSNSVVGLAGAVLCHFKRVCDVNMSFGLLVSGLAALVLGEAIAAPRTVWHHILMAVVGTWAYNLAVGAFYFDWGIGRGDLFLPSDVRLVAGCLLAFPALLIAKQKGRYKLFNSEW